MIEINNKTKSKINQNRLKKAAARVLARYRKSGKDVSIALVGDKTISRLNLKYRRRSGPTDVLAFPGGGNFLGEIIIGLSQIKRQAKALGRSQSQELIFILIHGLLHLLGYDDKTAEKRSRMIKLGEKIISELKLKLYDKNRKVSQKF